MGDCGLRKDSRLCELEWVRQCSQLLAEMSVTVVSYSAAEFDESIDAFKEFVRCDRLCVAA